MGDIVHALPAVSDIARHVPGAVIDWVAEESFTAIPALHPHVSQVFPVALRRWRKAWFSAQTRDERAAFWSQVNAQRYDVVIDLQGLVKSALLARHVNGELHGCNLRSAREPLAALFYQKRHRVVFEQSAVTRMRLLAALSLGYELDGPPEFGLQVAPAPHLPPRYAAIMPSASRATKLWPEEHWKAVMLRLEVGGVVPLVFSGNDEELNRAQRLSQAVPRAIALQRTTLYEAAQIVQGAAIFIGLDSGLTHLAGALGKPTIGIYCDYDPTLAPVTGRGRIICLGGPKTPPSLAQVLKAIGEVLPDKRKGFCELNGESVL